MNHLPPSVDRVIAAANRGDIDGFLAGFMPDGVVDDWGREFVGRKAIRRWSDHEFFGVQVGLTINSVTIGDKVVSVQADVGGGGFNGSSTFFERRCRNRSHDDSRLTRERG